MTRACASRAAREMLSSGRWWWGRSVWGNGRKITPRNAKVRCLLCFCPVGRKGKEYAEVVRAAAAARAARGVVLGNGVVIGSYVAQYRAGADDVTVHEPNAGDICGSVVAQQGGSALGGGMPWRARNGRARFDMRSARCGARAVAPRRKRRLALAGAVVKRASAGGAVKARRMNR